MLVYLYRAMVNSAAIGRQCHRPAEQNAEYRKYHVLALPKLSFVLKWTKNDLKYILKRLVRETGLICQN